jgi:hypothetical protein
MRTKTESPKPKTATPAKCVVNQDNYTTPHLPWVVQFGRLVVSRHPSQEAAEITARKLNHRMRIKDAT